MAKPGQSFLSQSHRPHFTQVSYRITFVMSIKYERMQYVNEESRQPVQDIVLPHLDHLLCSREYPKTICPSEVARATSAKELKALGVEEWRDLMPTIREVLWGMRQRGEVEILQRGNVVRDIELQDIKGPIRARKTQG